MRVESQLFEHEFFKVWSSSEVEKSENLFIGSMIFCISKYVTIIENHLLS